MTEIIFMDKNNWIISPLASFKQFVKTSEFIELGRRPVGKNRNGIAQQSISDSSANVYIHMFAKFLRWVDSQKLTIYTIDHLQISQFLNAGHTPGKMLNSAIRLRYLRLLERVFTYLDVEPNPARHAIFSAYQNRTSGHDQAKVALTEEQQSLFMQYLPEAVPFNLSSMNTPEWKRRRDRALLAMLLGAGLKVSEVVGMHADSIGVPDYTGSVPVTVTPSSESTVSRPHQTLLRPFAIPEVMQWLEERRLRKIPGLLLFPSNLSGGQLDKSTIYLLTKATYKKAGIDVARKGPRTLRNSFAVRELSAEQGSIEEIGEYLGLYERKSTEKYLITEQLKMKNRKN